MVSSDQDGSGIRPPQRSPYRIGVSAEAFGFGPASKAAAIVAGLTEVMPIEPVPIASSIAHEFLAREGIGGEEPIDVHTQAGRRRAASLAASLDLALVVMIPEAVPVLQSLTPVVYVDSLGFLWPAGYFDDHPSLRQVAAYIAQDVFDAARQIRSYDVCNVYAVGALTPVRKWSVGARRGDLVHVGGLLNTFSASDGPRYLRLIIDLIAGLVSPGTEVLMSDAVRAANPSVGRLQAATLSHVATQRAFAEAACVFTSPGLTSLLELASLGSPVVPLPPQNLSQAYIISEIAALPEVPDLWRMLAEAYPVTRGIPEEAGVAEVRGRNARYAASTAFRTEYRRLAGDAGRRRHPVPKTIVSDYDGVSATVEIIRGLLQRP